MKRKLILGVIVAVMLVAINILPTFAAPTAVINLADTYTLRFNMAIRYLDGTYLTKLTAATLTISDNTTTTKGVITNASMTVTNLGTVAMVGFVGAGTNPRLSLIGSDGETVINLNGTVRLRSGVIAYIAGRVDGWRWHAGGTLGDDPAGAAATWSAADSYNGSISALLTQDAVEGSTYVSVTPPTGILLSDLDTLASGDLWSFWHNLQTGKAWGPQVELRFTHPYNINPDGAGHVDITLIPHQEAGDGTWEQEVITSATLCGYYGNDQWDATAFDEFSGTLTLADVEAAINAEAAMQAHGLTCGNWVLTRVKVELWEAGARTCYVDDLTIKGTAYTFEPLQFGCSFRATP